MANDNRILVSDQEKMFPITPHDLGLTMLGLFSSPSGNPSKLKGFLKNASDAVLRTVAGRHVGASNFIASNFPSVMDLRDPARMPHAMALNHAEDEFLSELVSSGALSFPVSVTGSVSCSSLVFHVNGCLDPSRSDLALSAYVHSRSPEKANPGRSDLPLYGTPITVDYHPQVGPFGALSRYAQCTREEMRLIRAIERLLVLAHEGKHANDYRQVVLPFCPDNGVLTEDQVTSIGVTCLNMGTRTDMHVRYMEMRADVFSVMQVWSLLARSGVDEDLLRLAVEGLWRSRSAENASARDPEGQPCWSDHDTLPAISECMARSHEWSGRDLHPHEINRLVDVYCSNALSNVLVSAPDGFRALPPEVEASRLRSVRGFLFPEIDWNIIHGEILSHRLVGDASPQERITAMCAMGMPQVMGAWLSHHADFMDMESRRFLEEYHEHGTVDGRDVSAMPDAPPYQHALAAASRLLLSRHRESGTLEKMCRLMEGLPRNGLMELYEHVQGQSRHLSLC